MTKFIKNDQSLGFGIVGIIIIIAVILFLGGFFGYQYLKLQKIREEATMPAAESLTPPPVSTETQPKTNEIDISTWKTYRNEQYGFEFRYPSHISIGRAPNSEIGSVDKPIGGLYVGGFVFVAGDTEELNLLIVNKRKNMCKEVSIANIYDVKIVGMSYCFDRGGIFFVEGPINILIDGSRGFATHLTHPTMEYLEKLGSMNPNELMLLLSTFKFIPLEK